MIHEVFHDNGLRLLGSDGRCAHVSCSPVLVVADTPEEARIAAEAIADGYVACGFAFDCGVREAERDRALAFYEEVIHRERNVKDAAVAAERARIAAEVKQIREEFYEGFPMESIFPRLLRVVEGG